MRHHLGGALHHADLADAGDILAVPFDPELEILVRVETSWIDSELRHDVGSSSRELTGHLLDRDDDEFRWYQRRKAHHDVDNALVDAGLRVGRGIAQHEIGLRRRAALERALAEQR